MDIVEASNFFALLASQHPFVEIWPDADLGEDGSDYFWIVSRFEEGSVRNLAYVRVRAGQLEQRTYDASGNDKWIVAA